MKTQLIFILILNLILISSKSVKTEKPISYQINIEEQDTGFQFPEGWIFEIAKYYCDSLNVPREYVYDVGMNESGWKYPNDSTFIQGPDYVPGETSQGDLQMIDPTWEYWSKQLNLKQKNRKNLLIACIAYHKYCYWKGDSSWEKARYIYARGRWKPKSKWTKLEKRFMSKMNFKKYN